VGRIYFVYGSPKRVLVNGKQSAHKFLGTYNDYTSETSLWYLHVILQHMLS
jgi:hypothetical protein